MRYVSTRGGEPRGFCDILIEGLAPDGGLYLPQRYPDISRLLPLWRASYAELGYAGLALEVLKLFVDDIPSDDLARICQRAYSVPKFSDPGIVPVSRLSSGMWLAHASLGPTAAFKDIAMQLLGELFEYVLEKRDETLTILGATSGDTGSAAEYALLDKPRVKVFMLTPAGRMSPFQQAQMFSIDSPNVINLAVDGVFDDCQDLVKTVNADAEFKARYRIGAVNSINWARLLAQVVYYIAAWLQIADSPDQQVSFAVPTGNFGNICAAHIARQMGLPIRNLVLATNENNVLDEFVRTGIYRIRSAADTFETSSPSMDISKASNFERFVFDLLGRDHEATAELFGVVLPRTGLIDLSAHLEQIQGRFGFVSATSTHADRITTIKEVFTADNVVIDPHTADGVRAAILTGNQDAVVIETALAVKFKDTINEAINTDPPCPIRFCGLEKLPRKVTRITNRPGELKELIRSGLS